MSQYQPLIDYLTRHGYPGAQYLDDGAEGIVFTLGETLIAKFWRDTGEETSFEVWRDAPGMPILRTALVPIHKATTIHLKPPYLEISDHDTYQFDFMGLTIIDQVQVIDDWPDDSYWQLPKDYHGLQEAIKLCHNKDYGQARQITTPGTAYILDAIEFMCGEYDFASDTVLPGIGLTESGKLVIYDLI